MKPIIREYTPADFEAVKRLHQEMAHDYKLPDLTSPLFLVRKVAELDGKVVAVGALMMQVETYMWVDHEVGDPEDRWAAVQAMNDAGMEDAWFQGIDCAVLWCPPDLEKSFGKRLEALGFKRDREWHSWSRPTRMEECIST
jgi:hypothetical protein